MLARANAEPWPGPLIQRKYTALGTSFSRLFTTTIWPCGLQIYLRSSNPGIISQVRKSPTFSPCLKLLVCQLDQTCPHNSHSLIQLFGETFFSKSTNKVASNPSDKTKPSQRTFWSLLDKALEDLFTMLAMLQCFSLNKRLRNRITTKPTTHDSLYCKLLPSERSNTCGEIDCKGDKADYCRDYCRNQTPFVYHLKYTILAFHLACCLIAERILIKNILLNLQIMAAQPRSH